MSSFFFLGTKLGDMFESSKLNFLRIPGETSPDVAIDVSTQSCFFWESRFTS